MGQPGGVKHRHPHCGGKPPELKHLSRERKRKQVVIPWVVASDSGTAQTIFVTAGAGL